MNITGMLSEISAQSSKWYLNTESHTIYYIRQFNPIHGFYELLEIKSMSEFLINVESGSNSISVSENYLKLLEEYEDLEKLYQEHPELFI